MKLSALLQKNSRKKRRERYRYGYGWKKVGKNCSNKLVPYEYIKSYSIFVLALLNSLTAFFVVVVETISTICLSLLCFSFVWKYLVWMKPHTPLEAHNKEQTNVWISEWNGIGERERPKAKNTEKKRWINVRNFLLLQWLLGDDRHTQTQTQIHCGRGLDSFFVPSVL